MLRDNKIIDPRNKNYKRSTTNFGASKLTKRKIKILETEKLYKKYGPHSVFLYKPGIPLPDLSEYLNNIIEVDNLYVLLYMYYISLIYYVLSSNMYSFYKFDLIHKPYFYISCFILYIKID